jgi:hypothetical protein
MSKQNVLNKIFSLRGEDLPETDYSEKFKKLETKEEIESWLSKNHLSNHKVNDDLTVDIHTGTKFTTEYLFRNITFFPFKISKKSTQEWLDSYDIKNYKINDDLSVDVNGSVYLANKHLVFIPIQFGHVKGDFDCKFTQLNNTNGFPIKLDKSIDISGTSVVSLYGITQKIPSNFYCSGNSELTSLKHGPIEVGGHYTAYNTPIKNLKDFNCSIDGDFSSTYRKAGSFHPGAMLKELKGHYVDATNVANISSAYKEKNQAWYVKLPGKDLNNILNQFYKNNKKLNIK